MRGRKPKPTALKLLGGNPGKRAINAQEPVFETGIPEPPQFLNKEARQEWNRVAKQLADAGVLTVADRAALAAYCHWWSVYAEACSQMEGSLVTTSGENQYEAMGAWVLLAAKASERMHKFMTEFGLTPSSRSRLKVPPKPAKDPFAEFLGDGVIGKIG